MKRPFCKQFFISAARTCAKTSLGLACAAFLLGNPFPGIPAFGNWGSGQESQVPGDGEQPGISPLDDFPDYTEPEI